jgi:hypothetical protein
VGKEYHYLLSCGAPSPIEARQRWWVYDRWCEQSRGKPSGLKDVQLDVAAMQEAAALLQVRCAAPRRAVWSGLCGAGRVGAGLGAAAPGSPVQPFSGPAAALMHALCFAPAPPLPCGAPCQGVHDFSAFQDKKRPSGLGRLKRKKPHLAEKGIKPTRTPDKNVRHIWRLAVVPEADLPWPPAHATTTCGGGPPTRVRVEVAGNGFLYRMVRMLVAALVEVGHGRMTPAQVVAVLQSGDRARLPEAAPPHGLYLMRVLYEGDLPDGVVPVPRGKRGAAAAGDGGGADGGGSDDEDG